MKQWLIETFFQDRKFRLPRVWSNREIARFAPQFTGRVLNASAWKDEDKEGRQYSDYFCNAESYHLSNYLSEARGYQGMPNEFFLDLTVDLPKEHQRAYDCVFNHTTLEHIYDVHTAFKNLCEMSRDAVIIVVPFVQQMHTEYGDYWRFTPSTLERMFKSSRFQPIYTSYNNHLMASVYILMIAVRDPDSWTSRIQNNLCSNGKVPFHSKPTITDPFDNFVGCNAIPSFRSGIVAWLRSKGVRSRR